MSTVKIDDSDPSITWSGSWERAGNSNEYNHTCSGSKNVGDTAIVTFTGTSITVYGTIVGPGNTPTSTYTLDDGPLSPSFRPDPPPGKLYGQAFFASPTLPYGTHKLNITDTTNTVTGLWLDYFIVTTAVNANTTLNSSSSIPQPTGGTSPTPKAHPSSWIIAVSVVVGGCALLAALALAIYIARRRRLKKNEVHVTQTAEPFPSQQSFQNIESSLESSYGFSGIHRKGDLALLQASSVRRSYDLPTSSGTGSLMSDFGPQPPMYTKRPTA
ncbi:hypothetical protein D9619_000076 [Psilocybe cf. subviscida]|uniref:Uncharacterized protein n=1 Tax=Psilocybe cf. subviscida TaxID=2480587 RepID=A0A8H5BE41_9AGAR|nr:hypothetical protein D9619_000076 [Psilocybe cf. subviscida]